MKEQTGHIKRFIFALMCVLTIVACAHDDEGTAGEVDKALLVLRISPVNKTRAQDNGWVTEKIKSFRIIVLNEAGDQNTIEYNEKETFDTPDAIDEFSYTFSRRTIEGKKRFYFIANEEEVTGVTWGNQSADDKNKTLTSLLDTYKANDNAAAFKEWINSVYFKPTYTINSNNEIFLPYTSFYEGTEVTKNEKGKWENLKQQEMYIVPVATKFFFRFYNYHKKPVEIKNLSIKSIASENFLLGQVDETDQKKTFGGSSDEYYWVDWLAKVAEETHNNLSPDNGDINDEYGWISAYQMPETNKHEEAILISEANKNVKTIPVWTEDNEEALYLGPYYFPESRNYEEGNTLPEQDYILSLHLHDTETESTSGDFKEDLRIGNLKALFRDTCVLIQVTMRAGDVEVYAEMAPWEHKEVEGWAEGGSIIP